MLLFVLVNDDKISLVFVSIQVRLPADIQPRRSHSVTAITLCSGLVDVIVFGGISEDYDGYKAIKDCSRIAETTVITFGEWLWYI